MSLLHWINIEHLDMDNLSANPNAISFLEQDLEEFPESICWFNLSKNPNAISLLERFPERIHWRYLSENPNAI